MTFLNFPFVLLYLNYLEQTFSAFALGCKLTFMQFGMEYHCLDLGIWGIVFKINQIGIHLE